MVFVVVSTVWPDGGRVCASFCYVLHGNAALLTTTSERHLTYNSTHDTHTPGIASTSDTCTSHSPSITQLRHTRIGEEVVLVVVVLSLFMLP